MRPTTASDDIFNATAFSQPQEAAAMMDKNLALMRGHRNNIARYRKLLNTVLTDLERQYLERRLAEEQSALEKVAASTFPLSFSFPGSPALPGSL